MSESGTPYWVSEAPWEDGQCVLQQPYSEFLCNYTDTLW